MIGAGAAGLALVSELTGTRTRVALLESGGLEPDATLQELNAGRVVGHPYTDLRGASLRQFGGTTNHWTAWTEPLDPIDFEARSWIPDSGWPFDRATLDPFYARAARFLGLGDRPYDVATLERTVGASAWRIEGDGLVTSCVRIVAPKHRILGTLLHDAVRDAPNVTAYLHATALELVPDPDGHRVTHLRVRTGGGRGIIARAPWFVLAAGGIENARRLLLSSSVQHTGLGNAHDLVGRFFANHPSLAVGLQLCRPEIATALYLPRSSPAGSGHATLTLSAARQRAGRLLNLQAHLIPSAAPPPAPTPPPLATLSASRVAALVADFDRLAAGAPRASTPTSTLAMNVIAESTPYAESRVRLGTERDAFDQPRVVLEWRTRNGDGDIILQGVREFAGELGAAGIGRLCIPTDSLQFGGSFHHLGTTRMHTDPTRGVVDVHCRVHGVDNLFVAGSSVFPTYGTVNPTLTIIALALRLADHMKTLLT